MREYTNKIADLVDEGLLDKTFLIDHLLMWMSEDEVKEFYVFLKQMMDADLEDEE